MRESYTSYKTRTVYFLVLILQGIGIEIRPKGTQRRLQYILG